MACPPDTSRGRIDPPSARPLRRRRGPAVSWADGSLCGIDIEITGGDPETARIIAIAMVFVGDEAPIDNVSLLVDPGVTIPAEEAALHGLTTERLRAEGLVPAEALQSSTFAILGHLESP